MEGLGLGLELVATEFQGCLGCDRLLELGLELAKLAGGFFVLEIDLITSLVLSLQLLLLLQGGF